MVQNDRNYAFISADAGHSHLGRFAVQTVFESIPIRIQDGCATPVCSADHVTTRFTIRLIGDTATGKARRVFALSLIASAVLRLWSACRVADRAVPAQGMPRAVAAPPAALPEPIYWKQHLFLIPYQWGSAAEPGAARAVWLFVSKDRGASWQKISEAKPDVKAFNYRAEGDGEYLVRRSHVRQAWSCLASGTVSTRVASDCRYNAPPY